MESLCQRSFRPLLKYRTIVLYLLFYPHPCRAQLKFISLFFLVIHLVLSSCVSMSCLAHLSVAGINDPLHSSPALLHFSFIPYLTHLDTSDTGTFFCIIIRFTFPNSTQSGFAEKLQVCLVLFFLLCRPLLAWTSYHPETAVFLYSQATFTNP